MILPVMIQDLVIRPVMIQDLVIRPVMIQDLVIRGKERGVEWFDVVI